MEVSAQCEDGPSSFHSPHVERLTERNGGMMETSGSNDKIDNEIDPIIDIIDYLAHHNQVFFKSQQIGELDLSTQEKKQIALDLYKKGKSLFLIKFGNYLSENQLSYFEKAAVEEYDLKVIISQLQRNMRDNNRKLLVKNRRFEALTKMTKEDSYFSETEMMKRNPLLYEQLIGQYLSEEEKKVRDNIDTDNLTLLSVLLESMDRRRTKDILEKQKVNEDCPEEESSDDESSEEDCESAEASNWGEFEKRVNITPRRSKNKKVKFITATERALLREEFIQEMYRSFLAGEDENINYETIDCNTELDCLDFRGRDEEETYFDSETPEEEVIQSSDVSIHETAQRNPETNEESEDELDVYMEHLNKHPSVNNTIDV